MAQSREKVEKAALPFPFTSAHECVHNSFFSWRDRLIIGQGCFLHVDNLERLKPLLGAVMPCVPLPDTHSRHRPSSARRLAVVVPDRYSP